MLEIYSKSDIGMVRETNQDDLYCEVVSDKTAWLVVCDGMGGANGGDIASGIAVRVIKENLRNSFNSIEKLDSVKEVMDKAINSANKEICRASGEDKSLAGMGTTVVAALIHEEKICISHAGDSRAYIVNSEEIKQVTEDHSIVQEMVNSGEITSEQAENHPRKNIITRALGISSDISAEYTEVSLRENDNVLVCTDGLTNHVSPQDIHRVFLENKPEDVSEKLVSMANDLGGRDNITVVTVVR